MARYLLWEYSGAKSTADSISQEYDFLDIFYFMGQPLLNKIFLYEVSSGTSSRQHFSRVTEIFLRGSKASAEQLSSLIRMPENLKSLFWMRNATHSGHHIGAWSVHDLWGHYVLRGRRQSHHSHPKPCLGKPREAVDQSMQGLRTLHW